MTDSFSDALLHLARPHLAWVVEQYDRFQTAVPDGDVQIDLNAGSAWVGGRELDVGLVGSYAEDHTFLWGWANPKFRDTPVAEMSTRLREIGAQGGAAELAEGLVDLNHFPDPRQAADNLAAVAMGLLDARGLVSVNHGGRSMTYLLSKDPGLPLAEPDPVRISSFLLAGGMMLPGPEQHDGRGYATAVLEGYAAHHGLRLRDTPEGTEADLPAGSRVTVRINANDHFENVSVGEIDRSTLPASPEPVATPTSADPFPEELLPYVLPGLAPSLSRIRSLREHLRGLGWDPRNRPYWDPATGTLSYGGLLSGSAREIGVHRREARVWEWAQPEWEGAALLRSTARELGTEAVGTDSLDLRGRQPENHFVNLLAHTAVRLGEGLAVTSVVTDGGDDRILAVTDIDVPEEDTDPPDVVCEIVLSAASLLNPMIGPEHRYETMRAMILGYFEWCGVQVQQVADPWVLTASSGLYEIRVLFSANGTVNDARWGLWGTLA